MSPTLGSLRGFGTLPNEQARQGAGMNVMTFPLLATMVAVDNCGYTQNQYYGVLWFLLILIFILTRESGVCVKLRIRIACDCDWYSACYFRHYRRIQINIFFGCFYTDNEGVPNF